MMKFNDTQISLGSFLCIDIYMFRPLNADASLYSQTFQTVRCSFKISSCFAKIVPANHTIDRQLECFIESEKLFFLIQ